MPALFIGGYLADFVLAGNKSCRSTGGVTGKNVAICGIEMTGE